MALTLQIKRSTGTTAPSSLADGELAYTHGNEKFYIGDGSTVKLIGGKAYNDLIDHTAGTLTASSAILVDSNKAVDDFIVGNNSTTGGSMKFKEGTSNGTDHVALKAPNSLGASVTFTLPSSDGSASQFQQTNGSGELSFADAVTAEAVEDITAAQLVTNGSHTLISAAYDDAGDGAIDLTVDNDLSNYDNSTSGFITSAAVPTNNNQLTNGAGYITASSTDTLTNKSGNISMFTNDSGYLTSFTETNDLTAAVTWANVPDANITESSVTQHEAALSITESQISDLQSYLTSVSQSDVTQHQAALSITESQISDLGSYIENVVEDTTPQLGGTLDANGNTIDMGTNTITDTKVGQWDTAYGWGDHSAAGYLTSFTETNDLSVAVVWANVPNANITQGSVTQHQAALSIATTQLTGTITNAQLAGSITNAKLVNSSVTIGSDTVSLGGTQTDLNGITSLDVDNITVDGNVVSTTDTNGDLELSRNGTATVIVPSGYESRAGFQSQSLVNKAYVDQVANGLDVKASVRVATTENLSATYNNSNGTLTANANGAISIDGVSLSADDRVLVKDQTTQTQNGFYKVTTVGSGSAAFVLTRTPDANEASEITGGAFTFVEEGTNNADNGYVATHNGTPTLGTDNITFDQFSGAGQISAGNALTKTGNTLDVEVDDSSIEVASDALQVKALGITNAMLAGSIANAKLSNSTIGIGGITFNLGDTDATPAFDLSDATNYPASALTGTVANNQLANNVITFSDDSSTTVDVDLGSTLAIAGGEGIDATISGSTLSIIGELATTSNKGVASFSSDNFAVSSGAVTVTTIDGGTF